MPAWYRWLPERMTRFRRVPAQLRRDLLEAMLCLLAARAALRVIPFQRLAWFFERPPRSPEASFARRRRIAAVVKKPYAVLEHEIAPAERERLCRRLRWLVNEATSLLPGKTVCFPRAVAAQALLRQLGIGTTLYYGVPTCSANSRTAHTWLQDGDEIIIGHCAGQTYRVLARYPNITQPVAACTVVHPHSGRSIQYSG